MLDPHPTQRLSCWEMRGAQPPAASQTSNTAPVVLGASPVSDTPGTLRFSVSGSEKKKKFVFQYQLQLLPSLRGD